MQNKKQILFEKVVKKWLESIKNRVKQTTLDRYQCVTQLLIEELGLREMSMMAGEDLNLFLEMSTKLFTLPPESATNKMRLVKPHVSGSQVQIGWVSGKQNTPESHLHLYLAYSYISHSLSVQIPLL